MWIDVIAIAMYLDRGKDGTDGLYFSTLDHEYLAALLVCITY